MTPLAALLVRDMRIALRVGGGALMGVLFFLVVVTLIPFAIGGQTEEPTFPALQFLSQGKARGKAKPVPKTASCKRDFWNATNGRVTT